MKQHTKLLVALVLGSILGILCHSDQPPGWLTALSNHLLGPIGQIFLRLIFMIVVPMVFTALLVGVYELGQGKGLKDTALRTLSLTAVTSAASVFIGIGLVNLFRPGAGLEKGLLAVDAQGAAKLTTSAASTQNISQIIVNLIPKNPLDSAVRALDGEMVSLMVFALIFGVALSYTTVPGKENPLIELSKAIYEACMKIVSWVMKAAPIAVFSLVFVTASKFGHTIFLSLLFYVLIVVVGLLIQQFGVFGLMLRVFSSKSPIEFFREIRDVMLYAFATASSNATLPKSLDVAQNVLKLNPSKARFVLTVGSTANQNGTALFEGVTVLFLAQVYGIDLTFIQQIQVVMMSILAGIGTAGVPGGSLPLIVILLTQVGIPAEGIGIILGVDRFLDMCRTTVNVTGDLVIATIVGSGPGRRAKVVKASSFLREGSGV